MKRMLLSALAAAAMTCVCTTLPVPSVFPIDRAQVAYDRIATKADIIFPMPSPERAARVRLVMALAEQGLVAARWEATATEKLIARRQAEAATAAIASTTSNRDGSGRNHLPRLDKCKVSKNAKSVADAGFLETHTPTTPSRGYHHPMIEPA